MSRFARAALVCRTGSADSSGAALHDLEEQLARHLGSPRVTAAEAPGLDFAAARWSEAAWQCAETAGPWALSETEVQNGLTLIRHPVFVCGVHRSGTTLVRDLLDGHPALTVLPSEGTFYTNLERRLMAVPPASRARVCGCEWLRRLANPIHQAPYWLLGRSSAERSPYVDFARALLAWWPILEERLGASCSSWPIGAVALAYASTAGLALPPKVRHWVEKTPLNEQFLQRLYADYADCRVIHVVRNPLAVYASHKAAALAAGTAFSGGRRLLRNLQLSLRIGLESARAAPSPRYLLVRYEDLLHSTAQTLETIATFLGIEPQQTLRQPTAAGLLTSSNSSFRADLPPGLIDRGAQRHGGEILTRTERARIAAALGEAAGALGYELVQPSGWRARVFRLLAPAPRRIG